MTQTILITGATSGIGLQLARLYDKQHARLLLVGRRERDTLDTGFFTAERYIQADLSLPEAPQIISDFMTQQGITGLDVLIHNAGAGYFGDIPTQTPQSIKTVVDVNFSAPVALTHALLNCLREAQGKIVLISSLVAALPTPEYAVYAASKAALSEFGYNLRLELQRENIGVQVIHPGATRTDMHSKLGIPADRMDTSKFAAADVVAGQIVAAIKGNKPQVTIGGANKVLRFAGKHAARLIDAAMKRSKA